MLSVKLNFLFRITCVNTLKKYLHRKEKIFQSLSIKNTKPFSEPLFRQLFFEGGTMVPLVSFSMFPFCKDP